jgi:hypothetical protein
MHDHDIRRAQPPDAHHDGPDARGHSMWWMVVCCAPMVLVALAALLGVFGPR